MEGAAAGGAAEERVRSWGGRGFVHRTHVEFVPTSGVNADAGAEACLATTPLAPYLRSVYGAAGADAAAASSSQFRRRRFSRGVAGEPSAADTSVDLAQCHRRPT